MEGRDHGHHCTRYFLRIDWDLGGKSEIYFGKFDSSRSLDLKLIKISKMTVNGKMFCSNTNLVSSSRRIHTTPLLNFSFAQVIERITLITLFTASTINIISLPSKSSLLLVSSPSISSIHYPASRGSVAHSIHNSVHNIAKYIFPFPSFHHRAIESCPRSGTRALFCLAISPR